MGNATTLVLELREKRVYWIYSGAFNALDMVAEFGTFDGRRLIENHAWMIISVFTGGFCHAWLIIPFFNVFVAPKLLQKGKS